MTDSQQSLLYSKASNIVIAEFYAQYPKADIAKALKETNLLDRIEKVYSRLLLEKGVEIRKKQDKN